MALQVHKPLDVLGTQQEWAMWLPVRLGNQYRISKPPPQKQFQSVLGLSSLANTEAGPSRQQTLPNPEDRQENSGDSTGEDENSRVYSIWKVP